MMNLYQTIFRYIFEQIIFLDTLLSIPQVRVSRSYGSYLWLSTDSKHGKDKTSQIVSLHLTKSNKRAQNDPV